MYENFVDYLKRFCTNLSDESTKKIAESCDTIEDFIDQTSNWKSIYNFNKEQFAKCLDFIAIYKVAIIDFKYFIIEKKIFNDDENFENFYEYILKNTKEAKLLTKEFYKLIFFKCNMKYGDLVLVNANEIHNQRLAIYIGGSNLKSVVFYEFKKIFNKHLILNLLNSQTKEGDENILPLDSEVQWKKCNFNFFKIKQDYNLDSSEMIKIMEHNHGVIDSLEDGDVISMEGYKLFNEIVLYHHTALITGNF